MGDPIAVTIVGGYLGAGKTTLVNHVLAGADERIAVFVNDFGRLNIDESLIESVDGDTVTLANGCICCSLVDGLAGALADLLEVSPRPERLIIEASGVADPGDVAGYCHRPGYRLDLVLVLADAEQVERQVGDEYVGETVRAQLAAADLLVLNKTDLVEPEELKTVQDRLAQWSHAPVVSVADAAVDLALVFDRIESAGAVGQSALGSHGHHDDVFEAWSHRSEAPFERARFEEMIGALPRSVMRAKGVVAFAGSDERWVFQKVGPRHRLKADGEWSNDPVSEVVVIGLRASLAPTWLAEQLGS